jgi:arsenate reductase
VNRLWFNPRCSTARKSLELLRAQGVEPELRRYLDEPPTKPELLTLLGKLDGDPREIVRAKEAAYRESGLSEESTADEFVDAIVRHPILLQRPILEQGERAVVGRPPERVLELVAGG